MVARASGSFPPRPRTPAYYLFFSFPPLYTFTLFPGTGKRVAQAHTGACTSPCTAQRRNTSHHSITTVHIRRQGRPRGPPTILSTRRAIKWEPARARAESFCEKAVCESSLLRKTTVRLQRGMLHICSTQRPIAHTHSHINTYLRSSHTGPRYFHSHGCEILSRVRGSIWLGLHANFTVRLRGCGSAGRAGV